MSTVSIRKTQLAIIYCFSVSHYCTQHMCRCFSSLEEQHWRLSQHENFLRMRLRLCPNLHFSLHTDASNLRDNTGTSLKSVVWAHFFSLKKLSGSCCNIHTISHFQQLHGNIQKEILKLPKAFDWTEGLSSWRALIQHRALHYI